MLRYAGWFLLISYDVRTATRLVHGLIKSLLVKGWCCCKQNPLHCRRKISDWHNSYWSQPLLRQLKKLSTKKSGLDAKLIRSIVNIWKKILARPHLLFNSAVFSEQVNCNKFQTCIRDRKPLMKAKKAIKLTLIFLNTILSQIVSPVTIPLERGRMSEY